MSKQPKFDIYEDDGGEWRWRLKSANGKIITDSAEGYTTKAGAKRAVDTVIKAVLVIVYFEGVPQ